MTAAFQPPRTAPARLGGSRFFASPSRAPRHRHARPAKRRAGSKTAPGIFFAAPPKPHPETVTQVTNTHQESTTYVFVFAPGCAVAPNSGMSAASAAIIASLGPGDMSKAAAEDITRIDIQLGITSANGMFFYHGIPPGSQEFVAPNGQTFWAPAGTNFTAEYQAGQANGLSGAGASIGQWGTFDFQRNGGAGNLGAANNIFYTQYANAGNYGVGVYMNGAGYSLTTTVVIGDLYALGHSSNAGSAAQSQWWSQGWQAAQNGTPNGPPSHP